jgi:uncharacterized protein YndB with AHSA1/START domain
MTADRVLHETIVMERTYDALVARLFMAFADPLARVKWSAPSDTAIILYDETNFAVGGRDVFRCGARSDPKYRGETHYLHIVPDSRIVSSETIDAGGKRLSASLTTVEFIAQGTQTHLKLTVQVAAFEGPDMIEGTKFGHNAALGNLFTFLEPDSFNLNHP